MGTLSNKERDALEDVFLSIHSSGNRHINIKDYYSILVSNKISLALSNLLKRASFGLKKRKRTHFYHFFTKKKKPLS